MIISGARRVLYIQWGGFTELQVAPALTVYETSPSPGCFPNAVFRVITGGSSDVSGVGQQEMVWSLGKTKLMGFLVFNAGPNASMNGSYLAIGY